MSQTPSSLARGRGAPANPAGRFERLAVSLEREDDEPPQQVPTEIYKDTSRSIISFNDSPDIGMDASLNPYRGCEHGCIYCFARPYHEYLGMSAGVDFESKIFVKTDAPELLRKTLMGRNWQPRVVTLSGITDCYQPIERKLKITRACLEVMAEFRNPAVIITKNHLVTRDIDVLSLLAEHNAIKVLLSITTLDAELARVMEPRASTPKRRLEAIRQLHEAGIPVGVMMAPIIPGLTDHEIPALLEQAAKAGAESAGHTIVRLPYGVKDLFEEWLKVNAPLRKDKVLNRIRALRGGKLNDPNFGSRMRGEGIFADAIHEMFAQSCKRFGLDRPWQALSTASFRRPPPEGQLSLFG